MFLRVLILLFCLVFRQSCPNFSPPSSNPFPASSVPLMTQYFLSNLDYKSTGGIVASPDTVTPVGGGTYLYDWERDGALSMRAFMEINDYNLSNIKSNMDKYVGWVRNVQSKKSPFGFDVVIEPKYTFPNGDVFTGGWGRPQTDGPGLRATTLALYAKKLIEEDLVDEAKGIWEDLIKKDLDWIKNGWATTKSFDLWEDLESDNLFWNKVNQRRALFEGRELASYFGEDISEYSQELSKIEESIETHWNGQLYFQAVDRLKDGASIIGFNEAFSENSPIFLDPTSYKVASTVQTLLGFFCPAYNINHADDYNGNFSFS
jgi:glucoamylase